jgi:hypothetical protein
MVNEFDKEIDAMLRDLAKGDSFAQVLPDVHLDADEISAFAENALPQKARVRVIEHLADCSKCRKILSNVAFLNSESQSEIIHEEAKTVAAIAAIPWYQRLFAFPKLSYAMGGLALLLCGAIGLMVLQTAKEGNNSMVAQKPMEAANKPSDKSGGPSLEGDFPMSESYASNSTANAPSAMATPAPNAASPTSNSAAPTNSSSEPTSSNTSAVKTGEEVLLEDKKDADEALKPAAPIDLAKKEATPLPMATSPVNDSAEVAEKRDTPRPNEVSQNRADNIQNVSPDSKNVARQQVYTPPSAASGASQEAEKRAEPQKAKKKTAESDVVAGKDSSGETRRVGGKSFRRVNGVWTDTSYSGGSTKTVKRGSDDYKKLDSGLQSIGNSLSGTVIVVWGGKNYKIQ